MKILLQYFKNKFFLLKKEKKVFIFIVQLCYTTISIIIILASTVLSHRIIQTITFVRF